MKDTSKKLNKLQTDKLTGIHTEIHDSQVAETQRQRENLESSEREVTVPVQGILNKFQSRFHIGSHYGQKAVG